MQITFFAPQPLCPAPCYAYQLTYTLFGTSNEYGTARVSDSKISEPSIGTVFLSGD